MDIRIVTDNIPLSELREVAKEFYGEMIKGVVDVEKEIVAFGGEWHMDANTILIENGSKQNTVWGFNLYLDEPRESWIVCTSLINIRPHDGNRSIEVQDSVLCATMSKIVNEKIV